MDISLLTYTICEKGNDNEQSLGNTICFIIIILLLVMLLSICCPLFMFQVVTAISQAWASMELSYEEHYQTSVPLLTCDEELIEKLEDHQVDI